MRDLVRESTAAGPCFNKGTAPLISRTLLKAGASVNEPSIAEMREDIVPNLRRYVVTILIMVAFIGFALLDFALRVEWVERAIKQSPAREAPIHTANRP